jgi:predicted nucleic acid-binding protein
VRTELENRGTVIGAMDTLIAGHALARGWTLVASDDHFLRVDGLTIVDWTKSDQPVNRLDKISELIRGHGTKK